MRTLGGEQVMVVLNESGLYSSILGSNKEQAKVFGKNHSKVLRDIRELGCSEEFSRANFGLVNTKDKKGEYRPSYEITKDGFRGKSLTNRQHPRQY